MRKTIFVITCLTWYMTLSQSVSKKSIDEFTDRYFLDGVKTLRTFLELPNYGGDAENISINAAWCKREFAKIGFETRFIEEEGVKHVFAEKHFKQGAPIVLFYLQIDGQPVDPTKWLQESPYVPVLKKCIGDECETIGWDNLNRDFDPDWKIFARSVSDSKGPAIAFLHSLRIIEEQHIEIDFNIKVIMDFQEELGSPTLPGLVQSHRHEFEADAILIMDGTRPPANLPTLTFGARGIATMKLTVFGATKNLHSGQYGNYAPNPVFGLSRLLGAMKDEHGRVLIPGYYEGVSLSQERKRLLNEVPQDHGQLLGTLGIATSESVGTTYQEALQYPSFNVRGLRAGWVEEEVRTIIPSEALAEIDMRLVPETPAERQIDLVTKFIQSHGYYVLDGDPTHEERRKYQKLIKIESRIGSRPFRTPLNSPLGHWLGKAMTRVFGEGNYIRMQSTGGSQPIAPFITTLDIPAISVRIPNPDNSIHAPNENLRLGNFHEGLKMCLGILTQPYD